MGARLTTLVVRGKSARQVVVERLFHTRRSRSAADLFLIWFASKGGRATQAELSHFADDLAGGSLGPPFSRRAFYKTIRPRFITEGLVGSGHKHDDAGRMVRVYYANTQPIPKRRPDGPSLMYDAHLLSEKWNSLFR